jgi:tRNA threonylcarbamoyladenosine biosynthesis protein TsaB
VLILALDAALARCSAAVLRDGAVIAERREAGGRGQASVLPGLVADVLAAAGTAATRLGAVAVTIGPGSFTGIRAALALAHGIGLAIGRPVVGASVAEALAEACAATLDGRTLWTAIDSRRGRVFLGVEGVWQPAALDALPAASGPVAVAGDAAIAVAARLAARGDDVLLTDARLPEARHVALAGARRLGGALPPLAAQPLYIDPPEARLPAGGLRPAPLT